MSDKNVKEKFWRLSLITESKILNLEVFPLQLYISFKWDLCPVVMFRYRALLPLNSIELVWQWELHGRSQDFSKGGSHWVIHRVLTRLSSEYYRLFAYKKAYKGRGTGTPGPSRLRPWTLFSSFSLFYSFCLVWSNNGWGNTRKYKKDTKGTVCLHTQIEKANHSGRSYTQSVVKPIT